jgi:hypothetical protein
MAFPEAQLIDTEVTLRDMQLTKDVRLTRKSLVRWLALSLGLISPNESRTTMLELLDALLYFQFAEKKDPEIAEIMAYIKQEAGNGNEKAVRYHLLQLKTTGLMDRKKGKYFFAISPLSEKGDISSTLDYVYKRRYDMALVKIKDAFRELQDSFSRRRQPDVELVPFLKKKPST